MIKGVLFVIEWRWCRVGMDIGDIETLRKYPADRGKTVRVRCLLVYDVHNSTKCWMWTTVES